MTVIEQSLQEGDCVQVVAGPLAGKRGSIRACPFSQSDWHFNSLLGQWQQEIHGRHYIYVVFDEIVQRIQHTCEHGSIAMSAKWKWCLKTDIVKVANHE